MLVVASPAVLLIAVIGRFSLSAIVLFTHNDGIEQFFLRHEMKRWSWHNLHTRQVCDKNDFLTWPTMPLKVEKSLTNEFVSMTYQKRWMITSMQLVSDMAAWYGQAKRRVINKIQFCRFFGLFPLCRRIFLLISNSDLSHDGEDNQWWWFKFILSRVGNTVYGIASNYKQLLTIAIISRSAIIAKTLILSTATNTRTLKTENHF